MTRYFMTGTDTDCGKTYVTCEWLSLAAKHQRSAIGLKPVASGCHYRDGVLISDDAEQIQHYNASTVDICPWRFLAPISPHIAAEKDQQRLSAAAISAFCLDPKWDGFSDVIVEGAGGLMAPLNESESWIDVVKQADLTVILVVGMRLGCLNHALLTAAAIRQYQLPCLGWIANCIDPQMLALAENIETLQQQMNIPFLGTVPYQGHLEEISTNTL